MSKHALHTVTADAVIFAPDTQGDMHVLLIRRRWEPYQDCWALPGGHVDAGETTEGAARRELAEETGIVAPDDLYLVGVYDTLDRDPRSRVIGVAYVGQLPIMVPLAPADDAADAWWEPVDDLPLPVFRLAFDHDRIVEDARRMMRLNRV